jgi:hypothetical protein
LDKLKKALNEGLDAGLTVNEIKEVLILGKVLNSRAA